MTAPCRHPYPAFVPAGAQTLVLGSLPPDRFCQRQGLKSDDVDFYYGSRDNSFWPLVGEVFGQSFTRAPTAEAVRERCDFLTRQRIAVSDLVETCQRKGSRSDDQALFDLELRPLAPLLRQNPTIGLVLFTSTFVCQLTLKHLQVQGRRFPGKPREGSFPLGGRTMVFKILYSPSPLALRGLGPRGKVLRKEQYESFFAPLFV